MSDKFTTHWVILHVMTAVKRGFSMFFQQTFYCTTRNQVVQAPANRQNDEVKVCKIIWIGTLPKENDSI